MKSLFVFILLFLVVSCALIPKKQIMLEKVDQLKAHKVTYKFLDSTGEYLLSRESGGLKTQNEFVVKRKLYKVEKAEELVFEKSVSIYEMGKLKEIPMLRPKVSEYTVWFDKKPYLTRLKVDTSSKELVVQMKSPEEKFQGESRFPFPQGTGVFCFFSALSECVSFTGFLDRAITEGDGEMNFTVIWDGYPYLQEQYTNMPNSPFSLAKLIYEGQSRGVYRFTLSVENQAIMLQFDKRRKLIKMFWVMQGLSMIPIGEEMTLEEDEYDEK